MKPYLFALLGAALALSIGCGSRSNTGRGATVGAATGALIGGVIGHQSGETGEGAAIGAAVGGLAGGAYGARQDRAEQRVTPVDRSTAPYADNVDYLSLLTTSEFDTLRARARASGRTNYELTDFLTEQEKENLRRRAAERREVGR